VQVAEIFWEIQGRTAKKEVLLANQGPHAMPSGALLNPDYVERGA